MNMERQELNGNVKILCTYYNLEYLIMQKDKLQNGEPLNSTGEWNCFEQMFSSLTREELIRSLDGAILHYNDEEFKTYRDDWWAKNDREYDIQTLCICYSLECLKNRRDELLNGEDNLVVGKFESPVIKTAGIDMLNEAIADYNNEKYQRVRKEMVEEWKRYGIR